MFKSKYSSFLTIMLIVTIIAIIVIFSILGVRTYNKYKKNKDASTAIDKFNENYNITNQNNTQNNNGQALDDQNVTINDKSTDEGGSSTGKTRKVTYYNNYVMLGYIEIPVIRIKYPILEQETVASLEKAVAVRYPNSPQLNTVGNVVIVGHNYRNGMFFSNLKNVSVGDKIKITDTNGQTQVYTIYEKYETTPEDSTYITRDVGENIEITLVTCTDDSNARIIVKAKV